MSAPLTAFLQPSFTDRDNLLGVAWAYTRSLRLSVTLATLRDKLTAHPDYPSLLSLADILEQLKVENVALQIDAEQLAILQVPYVAHLRTKGGLFVFVESATADTVTYLDHKHQRTIEAKEDFLKKWSGVVFIAEPNAHSGEKDFPKKQQAERLENLRWPLIVAGFALLTGWGMYDSPTVAAALLLALKAIGTVLTMLLLSVQYGKTNDFTDALCHLNQKTDCNHILTSPAAKITDWLGWSEVGFFYFLGSWFYLISALSPLAPEGGTYLLPLWGLGGLALPYTFWSIWYQWRVAKQWCPLCVAVQVVIWLEMLSPLTPGGGTYLFPLWGLGGLIGGLLASFGGG